jgi:hypothetical protein
MIMLGLPIWLEYRNRNLIEFIRKNGGIRKEGGMGPQMRPY